MKELLLLNLAVIAYASKMTILLNNTTMSNEKKIKWCDKFTVRLFMTLDNFVFYQNLPHPTTIGGDYEVHNYARLVLTNLDLDVLFQVMYDDKLSDEQNIKQMTKLRDSWAAVIDNIERDVRLQTIVNSCNGVNYSLTQEALENVY